MDSAQRALNPNTIGKYEVLAHLATGGMAEVFLAMATGPGGFRKLVTIKRVRPELTNNSKFFELFLSEARISAGLSHSNIAQVFELGDADHSYYLVMEFIGGRNLIQVLREFHERGVPLPVGFSVAVVRHVCTALNYAHGFHDIGRQAHPIIHRDISPRNVMVDFQGVVKVIDFGIARVLNSLAPQSIDTSGTTGFIAPEQYHADDVDGRADLYSAGALLYVLLGGSKQLESHGRHSFSDPVRHATLADPSTFNASVGPALSAAVLKALSFRREDRFQTGKEMAQALEQAVGTQLFEMEQVSRLMTAVFSQQALIYRAMHEELSVESTTARFRELAAMLGSAPRPHGQINIDTESMLQTEPDESISGTEPSPGPSQPVERETVLVVDDSPSAAAVARAHLLKSGYRVEICTDSKNALQMLMEHRPALVILDVLMPDLDGFEVCRLIRESSAKSTPVIFLSGACSLEERVMGLSVGGDDFIRKPFEPEDFVLRVRTRIHLSMSKAA